jgi:hypothetical protein
VPQVHPYRVERVVFDGATAEGLDVALDELLKGAAWWRLALLGALAIRQDERDEIDVLGQVEQTLLQAEGHLLDAAGKSVGLLRVSRLQAVRVAPAAEAEDDAVAVASFFDGRHGALPCQS